jgi:hypothetical protein
MVSSFIVLRKAISTVLMLGIWSGLPEFNFICMGFHDRKYKNKSMTSTYHMSHNSTYLNSTRHPYSKAFNCYACTLLPKIILSGIIQLLLGDTMPIDTAFPRIADSRTLSHITAIY